MIRIKPIHLKDANEFVRKYHRHNIPTVGGKFAVACINTNRNFIGFDISKEYCDIAEQRIEEAKGGNDNAR